MNTIPLLPDDTRPIYSRLARTLAEQIESGRLKPGDALLSTRQLADQLGLSRGTVRKSYQELLDKGYIEGKPGSKTVVRQSLPLELVDTSSGLADQSQNSVKKISAAQWQKSGYRPLPLHEWREFSLRYFENENISRLDAASETVGLRQLKRAICRYILRYQGIRSEEDQLLIFANREQALDAFFGAVVKPNDFVALEDPSEAYLRESVVLNRANILPIALDQQGLRIDALSSLKKPCKLVYSSPTNHYPLGVVMPLERRMDLIAWAEQKQAIILEEANECDYQYGLVGLPSIYELAKKTPVFYLYSFGKMLYPLTNITALVLPKNMAQSFSSTALSSTHSASPFELAALTDFIAEGLIDSYIRRRQRIYKKLRQTLFFELTMTFGSVLRISREVSAHHLVVNFPEDWSAEKILACAAESKMPIISASEFYLEDAPLNQFFVGFSFPQVDEIPGRVKHFANLLPATCY